MCTGDFAEACDKMNQALSSSAAEAYLFFQAAMIFRACGNGIADRYFKLATEISADYECFHVHR
jgi:hypothetical protein